MFLVCFRFQPVMIRWSNQLTGRHFWFCLRGPATQASLNLFLRSLKMTLYPVVGPFADRFLIIYRFFLNHAFYSYIPYFWFFEGNTPFLTKCQMAPLAAGENWFHTWAMATMQPNQKLPHVTLAWSILGRTWSPFKEVCLLWCCNI